MGRHGIDDDCTHHCPALPTHGAHIHSTHYDGISLFSERTHHWTRSPQRLTACELPADPPPPPLPPPLPLRLHCPPLPRPPLLPLRPPPPHPRPRLRHGSQWPLSVHTSMHRVHTQQPEQVYGWCGMVVEMCSAIWTQKWGGKWIETETSWYPRWSGDCASGLSFGNTYAFSAIFGFLPASQAANVGSNCHGQHWLNVLLGHAAQMYMLRG